jgi:hypothetical protein
MLRQNACGALMEINSRRKADQRLRLLLVEAHRLVAGIARTGALAPVIQKS